MTAGEKVARKTRVDELAALAQEWLAPGDQSPRADAYRALIDQHGLGSTANRAIPVQSLYEQWSEDPAAKAVFAHRSGYLRGDAWLHVHDVLASADAALSAEADLEADHVAVLLSIAAALAAYADEAAQLDFAEHHLAWLKGYTEIAEARWGASRLAAGVDIDAAAGYRALLSRTVDATTQALSVPATEGAAAIVDLPVLATGSAADAAGRALAEAYEPYETWKARAYAASEESKLVTCGGCINGCAMRAIVKSGRLIRVEGVKEDPVSAGKLCAKGVNYVDVVYTPTGRITSPAKRQPDGSYRAIAWDTALDEIAEKLHRIIEESGPAATAVCTGVSAWQRFSANRLLDAIGSPNKTSVDGACKPSLNLAWAATAGAWPFLDFANADYVVFIGRSYADGIIPGLLRGIQAKHGQGSAHYVLVDPRRNSTAPYVDEWLPIRPGTDLALILAMSHVVVAEKLYDKRFIAEHTTGFEEYAASLSHYTPEWAQRVTDIPAETIYRIAREVATAEHGAIEQGFRGGLGNTYRNNVQTVRALALFNGLIGAYGKVGALNFPPAPNPAFGALGVDRFPAPVPSSEPAYDMAEHPFLTSADITASLLMGAARKDLRALIYYATNPVLAHANPADAREKLRRADLVVDVDVRWSETAGAADYVLPDVTFLEQDRGLAVPLGAAAYRSRAAIEPVHAKTLPADKIFAALAERLRLARYFGFSSEDLAEAALRDLGLSAADVQGDAIVPLAPKASAQSAANAPAFAFPNATGKLEFASEIFANLGKGRVPAWEAPAISVAGSGRFRLISGNDPLFAHTYSTLSPAVLGLARKRNLDRVWINGKKAAALGIAEGDQVEITSDRASSFAYAHVTDDIHPEAIFTASNLGAKQAELGEAVGFGIALLDHAPGVYDPLSMAAWTQENSISIRKVAV